MSFEVRVLANNAYCWVYNPQKQEIVKSHAACIISRKGPYGAICIFNQYLISPDQETYNISKNEWDPIKIDDFVMLWSTEDNDDKAIRLIQQKLHAS